MKRFRLLLTGASIVAAVLSFLIVQGLLGLVSSAFGACPDAQFAPQAVVPAGGTVEGIAVADFNGDGNLDLAVTNFLAGGGQSAVAILLGDGHGGFGTPAPFTVGRGATRVVASDFDADGKVDVAVLNSNDGTISVLLGDGRGGLGPQTTFPAGGPAVGLALGDFNDDGNSDLVVADLLATRVTVLLGLGNGTFSAPATFPVGGEPLLIAVGDLDGDGESDVVVDNVADGTVSILLGKGDGTFAPQKVLRMPVGFAGQSVAVQDLDGDGRADMVVADAGDDSVLVFHAHGDGSFDDPVAFQVGGLPVFMAVGDVNGDGRPDLAVGNAEDGTVSVLVNRGGGTFGPQTTLAVGNEPIPVMLGDFDRDGALDIVAGSLVDRTVSVLLNECTGNRPPAADAGADQVLECTGNLRALARLDGSASTDLDSTPGTNDDIASYEWSERGAPLASGRTVAIPLALGAHEVSLTVTDTAGATGSDAARVTVRDTQSPAIVSLTADPSLLSPPSHTLVPISVTAVANDGCDAAPTCRIDSVTSSEPAPLFGGSLRRRDVVLSDPGPKASPARLAVLLRSERAGTGPGRTYTIDVSCRDSAGNKSAGQTTVTVAHGRDKPGRTVRSAGAPRR